MFGLEHGTRLVGVADRGLLVTSLARCSHRLGHPDMAGIRGRRAHRTLVIRWETMWREVLFSHAKPLQNGQFENHIDLCVQKWSFENHVDLHASLL